MLNACAVASAAAAVSLPMAAASIGAGCAARRAARVGMPVGDRRDRAGQVGRRGILAAAVLRPAHPASAPCPRRTSHRRPCRAAAVRAAGSAPRGGGRRHRRRGGAWQGRFDTQAARSGSRLLGGIGALGRQPLSSAACRRATASPGAVDEDSAAASLTGLCRDGVARGRAARACGRVARRWSRYAHGLRSCRRRLRGRWARPMSLAASRCRAAAWSSACAKAWPSSPPPCA